MKRVLLAMISIIVVLLFTGCCLSHEWEDATCSTPKTCTKCGETEGETLEHVQGDFEIIKQAVGSKSGLKQAKCTVCGQVVAEETYERTKEDAVLEAQTEAIIEAKEELKKRLKNPSSLVVNNATFYYGEYDEETRTMSYAAVKLDYNAMNSFGGSERDTYTYFIVDILSLTTEQIMFIGQN